MKITPQIGLVVHSIGSVILVTTAPTRASNEMWGAFAPPLQDISWYASTLSRIVTPQRFSIFNFCPPLNTKFLMNP